MTQPLTLKQMRQMNNLSGEQVSKQLDIHINTVYAREHNPLSMSVEALLQTLAVYGYTLQDIRLPNISDTNHTKRPSD